MKKYFRNTAGLALLMIACGCSTTQIKNEITIPKEDKPKIETNNYPAVEETGNTPTSPKKRKSKKEPDLAGCMLCKTGF